jgi:hypothetical protein
MQPCRMQISREYKRKILTDDEDLSEENPSDSKYDVSRPNSEELDSGDELDSLPDDWNEEVVDEDA